MGEPAANVDVCPESGLVGARIADRTVVRAQVEGMRPRDRTQPMRDLCDAVAPWPATVEGESDFEFALGESAFQGLRDLAALFGWAIVDRPGGA